MVRQSQFVHFDLYGMASRAGAPAWACVDGITREGARVPGATRHLPYPAEPKLLYGVQPLAAGTIAAERAIEALDAMGRRLRCDGVVLLAAVASYPVPRALVEAPEQMTEHDRYRAWLSDAVRWFRKSFGETLLSIVEHVDEDYLHIHAYVVPDVGSDFRLQWEAIHPGRAALRTSIAMGEGKREQRKYYRKAMEGWQDNFHHAVSAKYGHARVGPRRRRLDRTEWLLKRKSERI